MEEYLVSDPASSHSNNSFELLVLSKFEEEIEDVLLGWCEGDWFHSFAIFID